MAKLGLAQKVPENLGAQGKFAKRESYRPSILYAHTKI